MAGKLGPVFASVKAEGVKGREGGGFASTPACSMLFRLSPQRRHAVPADNQSRSRRAVVIGGSLGGLFAGAMLRRAGWQVAIYERSVDSMAGRGGGIVLQPDVVDVMRRAGVDKRAIDLGVVSRNRKHFRRDGRPEDIRSAPQTQTSWSLIFALMKAQFGDDHYHPGKTLVALDPGGPAAPAVARFACGTTVEADLLVGADGSGSTVRQRLWPEARPRYAGYLAWRGLVAEADMPAAAGDQLFGDFAFANHAGSHMLGYLVPGEKGDTRPGHRLYNWVWYRVADKRLLGRIMTDRDGIDRGFSMAEGQLADHWHDHLRAEADRVLPPPFRAAVKATRRPFAQAIRDLAMDAMVSDRVVLIGDAAFIPRPHTAASTAKAAVDAVMLAAALAELSEAAETMDAALQHWQRTQIYLGRHICRQGRRIGDALLFGRQPTAPAR